MCKIIWGQEEPQITSACALRLHSRSIISVVISRWLSPRPISGHWSVRVSRRLHNDNTAVPRPGGCRSITQAEDGERSLLAHDCAHSFSAIKETPFSRGISTFNLTRTWTLLTLRIPWPFTLLHQQVEDSPVCWTDRFGQRLVQS